MVRSEATVEELLALVPEMDELELLRLRVMREAVPDPERAWDSSSAYTTVDKRIVSAEDMERSLREAEESLHQHVTAVYESLRPVFRAFYEGKPDAAAERLILLGENMENSGRLKGARQCYSAALTLALPLREKQPQILALRRIARVALALADFREAAQHYERSAQLSRDEGDLGAEMMARTGMANVLAFQGRWAEAEQKYRDALALATSGPPVDRRQELVPLYSNLGALATRMERLEEAEKWLSEAMELAENGASPGDLAACHINVAQLREKQGLFAEARAAYDRARALPVPPSILSAISTDLAELCIHEGHVTEAEEWGRLAEEHAIAAGSAYILGRMYQGRGNLARARGDEDGFTFFEKALEIAREKGYPFLEAETLANYAELRAGHGGLEEASAYLERARDIFGELGAVRDLTRVQHVLAAMRDVVEVPLAAGD